MFKRLWRLLLPTCTPRQVRTVRYAFSTMLVGGIVMGLAAVVSENSSYITISTTPTTVQEGEQFYIDVLATAHTPVNAVDITLTYPESQITIDSIDTGTSVITLWTEEPYVRDGKIHLSGGTFKRGFIGEHTIARVRATAEATGYAQVTTDAARFVAGDGRGTDVAVETNDDGSTRIYISSADGTLESEATLSIVTDVDGNGVVDLKDISAFMAAWLTKKNTFDFNGDGRMTFRDFSILLSDSFFK